MADLTKRSYIFDRIAFPRKLNRETHKLYSKTLFFQVTARPLKGRMAGLPVERRSSDVLLEKKAFKTNFGLP